MAAGSFPNCVLLENGSLRCFGELVADFQKDRWSVPRYVAADLGAIKQVACGMRYTCILLENGSLRCFGLSQRSGGTVKEVRVPVPTELGAVKEVAAGNFHTCTLLEDGSVRCFGLNDEGQCSVPTDLSTVADMPS